jgi:hypothetical protein
MREPTTDWITTPITADLLRGALDLECTEHGVLPHRLPARARAQCADGQLAMAEAQPSGVRLVFRTRATVVELDTLRTKMAYRGAPPRPDGVYDLLVDGRLTAQAGTTGGNVLMVDMATGSAETRPGPVGTVHFPGLPDRVKDVEIWLPHNEINLHYLDGRDLYGERDFAELPLPDQLHPDAATHHRIGERFAALAFGSGGPFGSDSIEETSPAAHASG